MTVYGYVFVADAMQNQQIPVEEQQRLIERFASGIGIGVDSIVIEDEVPAVKPFQDRPQGTRLLHGLETGDAIISLKAEWVLASAGDGGRLIRSLRKRAISLYCVDLQENISMPQERKLVVSEGGTELILKLLDALASCETSSHGEAIRATKRIKKRQGKYLGGPVPFGWMVNENDYLVQNPAQQKIIEEIKALREDRWSLRDISIKLRDRLGIKLSHEGIRRILDGDRRRKESEQKRLDSGQEQ